MINKTLCILVFLISANFFAQDVDNNFWTELLKKHVSSDGNVDYKGFKSDSKSLDIYLDYLVKNKPYTNKSTKKEQLAYWINTYNAFTVKLIIDNYPIKSIKDINNPWDKKFITIDNISLSLNDIEHEILRKMNEPRIHFVINCASVSCPKLLNVAFFAHTLENQLHSATINFINEKNTLSRDRVELSKIFKWFREDFERNGSLIDFLNDYSEVNIDSKAKIKFKDYNWALND